MLLRIANSVIAIYCKQPIRTAGYLYYLPIFASYEVTSTAQVVVRLIVVLCHIRFSCVRCYGVGRQQIFR